MRKRNLARLCRRWLPRVGLPVAYAGKVVIFAAVVLGVGAAILLSARPTAAESWHHAGTELDAKRTVVVKADELRPIMVVEFLHQGLVRRNEEESSGDDIPRGNVVVVAKNDRLVPARILQLGPGDFCRVAFETIAGLGSYEIFYGGRPPKAELLPKWTNSDGLLMETRRFARCNLRQLDSLRAAFAKAEPIGADYVEGVFHSYNPMSPKPGPFFSRYTGTMYIAPGQIALGGDYTFWTSSRDCSFLLIDDKSVVSAPGRHGPIWQARPELGKTVQLSAGKHKFEYYHAAAGNDAIMSLAWVQGPAGKKQRPSVIPPSVFRADSVGRAEAGALTTQAKKQVPDFRYKIAGEVPLPGEPLPLIGVSFADVSPPGLSAKAKYRWDFGDGQTSELRGPAHVYLCPGLYAVSLSVKRGTRSLVTTNRIYVERPLRTRRSKEKPHKLDDYMPILLGYEAKRLDADAARQLFAAFLWKADILATEDSKDTKGTDADNDVKADGDAKEKPRKESRQSRLIREAAERKAAAGKARKDEERRAEIQKLLAAAVEAARGSLAGDAKNAGNTKTTAVAGSDADVYALARLSATTARIRLGDSTSAFAIWTAAGRRIKQPAFKAMCELAAADIAIGDLLRPKSAQPLLQRAAAVLGSVSAAVLGGGGTDTKAAARLDRVWGDYHASLGNGKAARKSYLAAQARLKSSKSHVEKTAWQGARSRSTEQFLKSGDWPRAFEELQQWQEEFPADKIDGYLTLLMARRWEGCKKFRQAVALCEQLMAVNPDSVYADRMLLLGADCELKLKQPLRAKAMLHSILKDYPGSPLVPAVKKKLAELEEAIDK